MTQPPSKRLCNATSGKPAKECPPHPRFRGRLRESSSTPRAPDILIPVTRPAGLLPAGRLRCRPLFKHSLSCNHAHPPCGTRLIPATSRACSMLTRNWPLSPWCAPSHSVRLRKNRRHACCDHYSAKSSTLIATTLQVPKYIYRNRQSAPLAIVETNTKSRRRTTAADFAFKHARVPNT